MYLNMKAIKQVVNLLLKKNTINDRVLNIVDTIAFEGDFVGDFLKRIFINQLIHT